MSWNNGTFDGTCPSTELVEEGLLVERFDTKVKRERKRKRRNIWKEEPQLKC